MRISFIIPFYNTGKFLERCVESVYASALPADDVEVILVDDGSTDASADAARTLCARHASTQLLQKANGGAASARNFGLAAATGDYVWWVDSDDYLLSDQLLAIAEDIEKNGRPDIYAVQEEVHRGDEKTINCAQPSVPHGRVISGKEALFAGYMPSSAAALLFRSDFLRANNLRYLEGISSEDTQFTVRAMSLAKSAFFSDYIPYVYDQREGSVSARQTEDEVLDFLLNDVKAALSIRTFAPTLADREVADFVLRWSNQSLVGLCYGAKRFQTRALYKRFKSECRKLGAYPLQGPYPTWRIWLLSKIL